MMGKTTPKRRMYTSLREQYRQTQILLPQAKAQDATQGLLAPQDAKARGGMEASPIASLREQYRQTQILLPQAKAQDATRGLLALQDAKARGGMQASPIAARKTPSCHERRQLEWPYAAT
ncbi:hypothetical protein ABG768_017855 [Culter alburnus]|uniref:Uncharacterized protein n=1 Tax=Culter alburnus TaxID=194366 RepID=A0AAW1YU43_CULAL